MPRIEKECPLCRGQRGFWRDGMWFSCIVCKTQGLVKLASMAEYRRLKASVTKPTKVQTKQREKGK